MATFKRYSYSKTIEQLAYMLTGALPKDFPAVWTFKELQRVASAAGIHVGQTQQLMHMMLSSHVIKRLGSETPKRYSWII